MGPVFGDTELTLYGLRFKDGRIQVKFGNGRTELIADAEFVDATTVKCKTPNVRHCTGQSIRPPPLNSLYKCGPLSASRCSPA